VGEHPKTPIDFVFVNRGSDHYSEFTNMCKAVSLQRQALKATIGVL